MRIDDLLIGDIVRYKNDRDDTLRLLYIDYEDKMIVTKMTWWSYGRHVSFVGIPFSEVESMMEKVS